nr:unnamed protein product [Haemonchus contortus]
MPHVPGLGAKEQVNKIVSEFRYVNPKDPYPLQWIKPIGGGGDRTELKSISSQEDSQLLLGEPYTSTRSKCEKITNNFEASNHQGDEALQVNRISRITRLELLRMAGHRYI